MTTVKRTMGIANTRDCRGFGPGNVIGWDRGVEEGAAGAEMGVGWGRGWWLGSMGLTAMVERLDGGRRL